MHFGRIDPAALKSEIHQIAQLPPDPQRTQACLRWLNASSVTSHIAAGCAVWGERSWVGSFYPERTKTSDFLARYAETFDTVELNSSFYAGLDAKRVATWCAMVPPRFKFCPKLPRVVSEAPGGPQMQQQLTPFLQAASRFGERLGVIFIQFPDTLTVYAQREVESVLAACGRSFPLVVEFRHPSWFANRALIDPAIDLLWRHGASTVISDTLGRRDTSHLSLSGPRLMVRYLATQEDPRADALDELRLKAWAERLLQWTGAGLQEVFFCVHAVQAERMPKLAQLFQNSYR